MTNENVTAPEGRAPPAPPSVLSDLIARLTVHDASRETAREILLHFGWTRSLVGHFYGPLYRWSAPDFAACLISGDEDVLPNPLVCLSAARVFAERVLPPDPGFRPQTPSVGWKINLYRGMVPTDQRGGWFATVRRHATDGFEAADENPALALCLAVLKACAATHDAPAQGKGS